MLISRIVKWLKSEICSIWYYYLPIEEEAIEQEIEEFLAKNRAESLNENLEREREGEDAYLDYQKSLAEERKAQEEEEKLFWDEVELQERRDREDNEFPSDCTDLDNPGGTKFCS